MSITDIKFTNNARTLLSTGSLADDATSVSVDDGSVFPALSSGNYFYATLERASDSTTREIVKVTARSGNTLTIVRAQDNTSATTFSADDIIELRVVAKAMEDIRDAIGTNSIATFKYTATAGQTTFSGNDDASNSLLYSVGNLIVVLNGATLINGTDYTASNTTSVVLTDAATVGDELIIYAFAAFTASTQALTLFKYSATAGQTTFSGSDSASQTLAYTAGMIIVTLNGVVLDTSDYTATNGTSVVLDSGASASDELNIIAFTAFNSASVTTASADFSIGDDLSFTSDGAIINMGANSDVTITHVHDTGVTLSAGDNDTVLQIDSNNDDAGSAPKLVLNRTTDSPADNDQGGVIKFDMENDNNQQFNAANIFAKATDVSDTTEDSSLHFQTITAGSSADALVLAGGRINSSAYSPAGSIVQVVQNTSVGQASTSSTSAVDVTNFTVDITPSSASNYIIVCISCHQQYTLVASTNVQYWHKFIGGNLATSGKLIPAQPWAGIAAESGGGGLQAKDSYAWIGMDNPESTSAVTYKVQHYVTSASSTGYCYYGQIVCMEVQV